jgi:hypothetical protein
MYTQCTTNTKHAVQIEEVQQRLGRKAGMYDYGRAALLFGPVSINGTNWKRFTVFDYVKHANRPQGLAVGQIRDFVVVSYKHKDYAAKKGRVKKSNLNGKLMFVRARQYTPTPARESRMWLVPAAPVYKLQTQAVSMVDLCGCLHVAKERNGREHLRNLVQVATAMA